MPVKTTPKRYAKKYVPSNVSSADDTSDAEIKSQLKYHPRR